MLFTDQSSFVVCLAQIYWSPGSASTCLYCSHSHWTWDCRKPAFTIASRSNVSAVWSYCCVMHLYLLGPRIIFLRQSLSTCLLLYGCERNKLLSTGMVVHEEITGLLSRYVIPYSYMSETFLRQFQEEAQLPSFDWCRSHHHWHSVHRYNQELRWIEIRRCLLSGRKILRCTDQWCFTYGIIRSGQLYLEKWGCPESMVRITHWCKEPIANDWTAYGSCMTQKSLRLRPFVRFSCYE